MKTRFQLQNKLNQQGVFECFKSIVKNEGVTKLYRGIFAPILVEAPKRATKFAANEQFKSLYKRVFSLNETTLPIAVLTGSSAGVIEANVVVPFELIKIKMQDKSNVLLAKILGPPIQKHIRLLRKDNSYGRDFVPLHRARIDVVAPRLMERGIFRVHTLFPNGPRRKYKLILEQKQVNIPGFAGWHHRWLHWDDAQYPIRCCQNTDTERECFVSKQVGPRVLKAHLHS